MTTPPQNIFYEKYFGHLVPGTLNVRLATALTVQPDLPPGRWVDGQFMLAQRCQVANLEGFIITTRDDGTAQDDHGVVHIVSAFPLRRFLRLTDGADVTLKVSGNVQLPTNNKGRQ